MNHLGVQDIIVTGHYECGAVRAASSKQDLGVLEHWLRLIRDVYRLHQDYLDSFSDLEERHRRLVGMLVSFLAHPIIQYFIFKMCTC